MDNSKEMPAYHSHLVVRALPLTFNLFIFIIYIGHYHLSNRIENRIIRSPEKSAYLRRITASHIRDTRRTARTKNKKAV